MEKWIVDTPKTLIIKRAYVIIKIIKSKAEKKIYESYRNIQISIYY